MAEAFLAGLGWDTSTLVDDGVQSATLDNREDVTFRWRVPARTYAWTAPDGSTEEGFVRLSVRVQGAEVGFYSETLVAPEGLTRVRSRQGNQAAALQLFLLPFVFLVTAIVVLVREVRRNARFVPWGRAATLGFVLALMGSVFMTLMQWTSSTYAYSTSATWTSHLAFMGFGGAIFGALMFVGYFVLIALADPLGRR